MCQYHIPILILILFLSSSVNSNHSHSHHTPSAGTIPNTPTLNLTPPVVPQPRNNNPNVPKQTLLDNSNVGRVQHPQEKPAFPLTDEVRPKHPERILTQTQPSKVIEGTVEGQEVHYQKPYQEQVIELEVYKVRMVDLNYQHIKTYSFQLDNKAEFHLKVQHDTEIKGTFMMYWEQNGAFSESTYEAGQELQFSVFQNRQSLLFHQNCYHTMGFRFWASKGNTYSLNFRTQGYKKLVSIVMENYITERSGSQKLNSENASEHEMATEKIKNTLRTFYGVVEKNLMMNQQIAENVSVQSKRYMSYQIVEMVMVILGGCVQVYLLKKLLNPQSVV